MARPGAARECYASASAPCAFGAMGASVKPEHDGRVGRRKPPSKPTYAGIWKLSSFFCGKS